MLWKEETADQGSLEWLEEGSELIRVVRTDLMEEGTWKPRLAGMSH